jgi:hypothetical protein
LIDLYEDPFIWIRGLRSCSRKAPFEKMHRQFARAVCNDLGTPISLPLFDDAKVFPLQLEEEPSLLWIDECLSSANG